MNLGFLGAGDPALLQNAAKRSPPNEKEKEIIRQTFDKHMKGKTWRTRGGSFTAFQAEAQKLTGYSIGFRGSGDMIEVTATHAVELRNASYSVGWKGVKTVLFSFPVGMTILEEKRLEKYGTINPTGDDVARSMGYDIKMTNRSGQTIYTTPESIKTTTEVKAMTEQIPIDLALQKRLSEQKVTDLSGKPITTFEMKKMIENSIDTVGNKKTTLGSKVIQAPILIIAALIIIVFLIFGISRRL